MSGDGLGGNIRAFVRRPGEQYGHVLVLGTDDGAGRVAILQSDNGRLETAVAAMELGSSHEVALTSTSANQALGVSTTSIRILSDFPCRLRIGDGGGTTALTTDHYIPSNTQLVLKIPAAYTAPYVAAILDAAGGGTLYISELV